MENKKKKTAVVICPGRGTYGKNELGYLNRLHKDKTNFINIIDNFRKQKGQQSISELDKASIFSPKDHTLGENAADLIYACSKADYLDINLEEYEIVAITGNSMGWYIACACAGVFTAQNAIKIINTMGSQMKDGLIGGQILYPQVDENWLHCQQSYDLIEEKLLKVNEIADHYAYTSIYFGGLRVIGGNDLALKWLLKELPPTQDFYPFKIFNNAAFHTPLLEDISKLAKKELSVELFDRPTIPLIDGRGKIWMPYATDLNQLWEYTLGQQVDSVYDFSRAITVAIKEFAPDNLIITGPGMNMGGAVAQVLIKENYKNINNKNKFKQIQKDSPYILAMGDPQQRRYVCSKS